MQNPSRYLGNCGGYSVGQRSTRQNPSSAVAKLDGRIRLWHDGVRLII